MADLPNWLFAIFILKAEFILTEGLHFKFHNDGAISTVSIYGLYLRKQSSIVI